MSADSFRHRTSYSGEPVAPLAATYFSSLEARRDNHTPAENGAPSALVELSPDRKPPFLSVITRTQGKRIACLNELFTALLAQTDSDFELCLLGHQLTESATVAIEHLIQAMPQEFQDRIRLIPIDRPGRTAPLNDGFAAARGEYIAMCDDDDIPMSHWVQTFHEMAAEAPGRLLRTVCVVQDVVSVVQDGKVGVRAVGEVRNPYEETFDLIRHLHLNQTPNLAIAFPRSLYSDLHIQFDETLNTQEDWDFILRCARVAGVHSRNEITCIYRWWVTDESSQTEHSTDAWRDDVEAVINKLDEEPLLLDVGSASKLRALLIERAEQEWEIGHLRQQLQALEQKYQQARELHALLTSRRWSVTKPLRRLSSLFAKKPAVSITDLFQIDTDQLVKAQQDVLNSTSWEIGDRLARVLTRD